ncbi:MAG TPA: endo-1,4-beta-xylanase [Rhizomicrobium sp.]
MDQITRRRCMAVSALSGAAVMVAGQAAGVVAGSDAQSLASLARAKGLTGFGNAIGGVGRPGSAFSDLGARQIQLRECNILVPENELKWTAVRPNPKDFNFADADVLVAWAEENHMKIRGHNLLWLRPDRNSDWLNNYDFGARPGTEAERLLREHVTTVCKHYGNRIFTWDVVNEAIDPMTGRMRDMVFSRHLGDDCMDIVFDAARKAAPQAVLVYNDFMTWGDNSARHREGVLKLLDRMKSRRVPVDALGVQSHIGAGEIGNVKGTMTFDAREQADWKNFMDAVTALYPRLQITEFDVSELGTPADIAARDRIIADLARRYLDMMLRYPGLDHVMCWGMLDHHSWLQGRTRRPDGMLKRGCPYDANYAPKPLRQAIADAFRGAPVR